MTERQIFAGGGAVPHECFFETQAYRRARDRILQQYPANTAVLGEVRSGKSSTIDAIVREGRALHSDRFDFARVRLAEATRPYQGSRDALFLALRDRLNEAWGGELIRSSAAPLDAIRGGSLARLSATGRTTVIVVDDFEAVRQLLGGSLDAEMLCLRELIENPSDGGLVSLITCRRSLTELEAMFDAKGSRFFTLFGSPPIWLNGLEEDEAEEFVGRGHPADELDRRLLSLVGRSPAALHMALHDVARDRELLRSADARSIATARRGPLAQLWTSQRELYEQWRMRLAEDGPHTGGLWGTLLRLAHGLATSSEDRNLRALVEWGYVCPDDVPDPGKHHAAAFRPFSELFAEYLRTCGSIPSDTPLHVALGNAELALRLTVRDCVLRLRGQPADADAEDVVEAWLRERQPRLAAELETRLDREPRTFTVSRRLGLLELTHLHEIAELFQRSEVFAEVPERARREISAREWRTSLSLLVQIRNPVAHYRVLRADVHDHALAICKRIEGVLPGRHTGSARGAAQ